MSTLILFGAQACGDAAQAVADTVTVAGQPVAKRAEHQLLRTRRDPGRARHPARRRQFGRGQGHRANQPRIEAGTPWRLEGGQAQVTLVNAGTVTFTPDVLRVISHAMICMPVSGQPAPVAAMTRVG